MNSWVFGKEEKKKKTKIECEKHGVQESDIPEPEEDKSGPGAKQGAVRGTLYPERGEARCKWAPPGGAWLGCLANQPEF